MTEWTNRMSIERMKECEKCKSLSYDHILYVEGNRIFVCCEACAKNISLKPLHDLLSEVDLGYKSKIENAIEQLVKFEFPNIKNLKVENNTITFDEGEYTQQEVETRIAKFIKSCQK